MNCGIYGAQFRADHARQQHNHARRDLAGANLCGRSAARLEEEGTGPIVSTRNAIKQFGEQVDGLAATLDQGKLKAPSAPRWADLDMEQEAVQLAALRQ